MASLYRTPLTALNKIGDKRAQLFAKLGVHSVGELINYYPRSYEDWSTAKKINELEFGETCCFKATLAVPVSDKITSGGRILSRASVCDETGSIQLVFFNNRYISSMLRMGCDYMFYGKVTSDSFGMQMVSPTFSPADRAFKIRPIYSQTAGLNNRTIESAVHSALAMLPPVTGDPLPDAIKEAYGLCSLRQALFDIHFPPNRESLNAARKRLVCEELAVLNLGMRELKERSRGVTALKILRDCSKEFEALLPFELTNAQKRAIADCTNDLINGGVPMNRLVQGDVGSGKTAVAASVCYTVMKNGFQAAFMAPTEILARQHFKTFTELFKNTPIKVGLLTGSQKVTEARETRRMIKDGSLNMVVGTHALITDKTEFNNLGIAVTDEQHRFGVAQRAKLLSKGNNPHLLVMSATPIPRTLGLIIFGDLDISVIDELPPGRKHVTTVLRTSAMRGNIYKFIRNEAENGRQAYIVCPLVEEGESGDLASAEEYAAELMQKQFRDIPVGLVHGKMKSAEKDEVMRKFSANEISVLVATTVIEVGVDVPNATVMVIENAERFGLSQLHQLRGRVGRGSEQSFCILISDNFSQTTRERLEVMCQTDNGFVIADADLKMRGPGDFFGSRQHGLPQMAIADFADVKSLELSQKIADDIIFRYKDLRNDELRLLKAEVDRLFSRGGKNSLN